MTDRKILIVEDESIIAEDIAAFLEEVGYQIVDIVASGEDAIAMAHTAHPHLILMDIMLHGQVDGIEAASHIQADLGIPVVYLTANADDQTLERLKATNPFGYILKPYKEKELQTAVDIALARHAAEAAAQNTIATMQVQSDRKQQYFSMASHEFRTPLSVIQTSAEILQNYGHQLTEAKKEQGFQRIHAAVNSMSEMIDDILVLSDVDCNTLEFSPILLEVVSFCQETIEAVQWSGGLVCTLNLVAPDEPIYAYLDSKLLWHLLDNLLSNAIKYSPSGGEVSLTVSQTMNQVWLNVCDQGIGIPSEYSEMMFEPFQRAANVGKIPGTGLGLTIVKRAVDLHGGTIAVNSEIGRGTTFTVSLPIQPSC